MKTEELVQEVSLRTGVMPEVTEIVLSTAAGVIGERLRALARPAMLAGAAGALALVSALAAHRRRRRA